MVEMFDIKIRLELTPDLENRIREYLRWKREKLEDKFNLRGKILEEKEVVEFILDWIEMSLGASSRWTEVGETSRKEVVKELSEEE
jgi:hypothetical protein